LKKDSGIVLHVYHDDDQGNWIRDVYELDSEGKAKFHSYITRTKDAAYETDIDLAIAHGQMK
jgi:hypothetical protein